MNHFHTFSGQLLKKSILLGVFFAAILFSSSFVHAEPWTEDGGNIYYDDGGNVGIGTESPNRLLDIFGFAKASKFILSHPSTYQERFVLEYTYSPFFEGWGFTLRDMLNDIDRMWVSVAENLARINFNGRVGIGSKTPASDLVVSKNGYSGSSAWAVAFDSATNDNTTGILHLRNSDAASVMYVRSDGRIGLGTEYPAEKLDVRGNMYLDGNIVTNGDICIGNCSGAGAMRMMGGDKTSVEKMEIVKDEPIKEKEFEDGEIEKRD